MYQESVKVAFPAGASHLDLLALIAELSRQHPKYFMYSMKYLSIENHCTLTALNPDVWEDVLARVQAAEATGILQITAPKYLVRGA